MSGLGEIIVELSGIDLGATNRGSNVGKQTKSAGQTALGEINQIAARIRAANPGMSQSEATSKASAVYRGEATLAGALGAGPGKGGKKGGKKKPANAGKKHRKKSGGKRDVKINITGKARLGQGCQFGDCSSCTKNCPGRQGKQYSGVGQLGKGDQGKWAHEAKKLRSKHGFDWQTATKVATGKMSFEAALRKNAQLPARVSQAQSQRVARFAPKIDTNADWKAYLAPWATTPAEAAEYSADDLLEAAAVVLQICRLYRGLSPLFEPIRDQAGQSMAAGAMNLLFENRIAEVVKKIPMRSRAKTIVEGFLQFNNLGIIEQSQWAGGVHVGLGEFIRSLGTRARTMLRNGALAYMTEHELETRPLPAGQGWEKADPTVILAYQLEPVLVQKFGLVAVPFDSQAPQPLLAGNAQLSGNGISQVGMNWPDTSRANSRYSAGWGDGFDYLDAASSIEPLELMLDPLMGSTGLGTTFDQELGADHVRPLMGQQQLGDAIYRHEGEAPLPVRLPALYGSNLGAAEMLNDAPIIDASGFKAAF